VVPRAHPVGMYRPNQLRRHRRSHRYGHVTARHAAPALALRGNRYFLHRKYDHPYLLSIDGLQALRTSRLLFVDGDAKQNGRACCLTWMMSSNLSGGCSRRANTCALLGVHVLQVKSRPSSESVDLCPRVSERRRTVELGHPISMPTRREVRVAATASAHLADDQAVGSNCLGRRNAGSGRPAKTVSLRIDSHDEPKGARVYRALQSTSPRTASGGRRIARRPAHPRLRTQAFLPHRSIVFNSARTTSSIENFGSKQVSHSEWLAT